jgi:hypothetical protein
MKYMADVVEAGGRLTQTYDWFLNVRIVFFWSPSFLLACSYAEPIAGVLRRYS